MNTKSTTETDRTVGLRIATLRKAKGLSQTALGKVIGVTFQQVQKYEKGQNRVAGSRLQQIAQFLDVPLSALFGDGEPDGQSDAFEFLSAPGAVHLLRAYAAIDSDELRRNVLQLVRTAGRLGTVSIEEPV